MTPKLPSLTPSRLAVKVKPSIEKIIRKGHPWVYDRGIVKLNKEGQAGDIAVIFDQKKNQVLAIGLYDPASVIRIKIVSLVKVAIDRNFFSLKVQDAYQKRIPLLQTDTNSYRLIHGENDGLPSLIADVYAEVLVLKLYASIWLPYLEWILQSLQETSGCTVIVLRLSRQLQKEPTKLYGLQDGQVLVGNLADPTVPFKEHGLRFCANVIKGHKTGFFLDHRHNRKRVGELAKGKSVLDVFAYAGGFSVHAIAGGATSVTSLDISAKALAVAQQNMVLNFENPPHLILAADAFKGLEKLYEQEQKFDLIIIDPPAFAKKESEIEGALYQYARLAKAAVKIINKNGILLMASCSSRVEKELYFTTIMTVLKEAGISFEELERSEHDIDHPISFKEGAYLKSIYFRIG